MEKNDRILHDYSYYGRNFDKEVLNKLIIQILYVDHNSIPKYLYEIKQVYNLNNYMYILEKINNSLVELFSKTYTDYCANGEDLEDYKVLKNIKDRNRRVLNAYNYELNQFNEKKQEISKIKKFKAM